MRGETAELLCQCVVNEDPDVHWQKKFLELNTIINCQFVYGATVKRSAWQAPQICAYTISSLFLKKKNGCLTTQHFGCVFFFSFVRLATWIFTHTIMSHLVSASVRLRFILHVVSSRHVTRGIESFMRFAECRDPNSHSLHISLDARRVATGHAPFVASQQECLFADS